MVGAIGLGGLSPVTNKLTFRSEPHGGAEVPGGGGL
jgi:hypothetical protein